MPKAALAQSVHVTNLGQSETTILTPNLVANAFTTGGATADRFALTSVVISLSADSTGQPTSLTLNNVNNSNPGTQVGNNLVQVGSATSGQITFNAPSTGITLSGDTNYFVVVNTAAGSATLKLTSNDSEDSTSTDGWSIANFARVSNNGTTWNAQPNSLTMLFRVNATKVPALGADMVTLTEARLTISNHSGNWYYKADRAPHNTCSTAVTGTTVTLTGLTANTAYVYKAYSDTACTSANELTTDDTDAHFNTTTDTTPPAVTNRNPSAGATGVARNANLVLTFDENVQRDSARYIRLWTGSTMLPITVSATGNRVTINPTNSLAPNTEYAVQIQEGAIEDSAGNHFAGYDSCDWCFTTGSATVLPPAPPAPPQSSDASLRGLEIKGISLNFDPQKYSYTADVPYNVTSVTITPTASHSGADITVNGERTPSGESISIDLEDDGETTIEIVTTAEDGTQRTYTLTIMSCLREDRTILGKLYYAMGGDAWHENGNWNSEEPLGEWFGVGTSEGDVVSLRLGDNGLTGDMPRRELLCLLPGLKELALWGNDGLSGDIPQELNLAAERAVLRNIAESLSLNKEWFDDYEEPFEFEDWHGGGGITTNNGGRVTELDFTGEGIRGEIPGSVFELQRLEEIRLGCEVSLSEEAPEGVMVEMADECSSGGGCALGSGDSSALGLFLASLLIFATLAGRRARG